MLACSLYCGKHLVEAKIAMHFELFASYFLNVIRVGSGRIEYLVSEVGLFESKSSSLNLDVIEICLGSKSVAFAWL